MLMLYVVLTNRDALASMDNMDKARHPISLDRDTRPIVMGKVIQQIYLSI